MISQELITNVDTNYLKPNLMLNNLSTKVFNNGDSIFYVKNYKEPNLFNDINKPAFTIVNNSGVDYFFYNYRTIIDKRGIIPKGLKIPTINDLNYLKISLLKNTLSFKFIGYIDDGGYNKEDGKTQHFWFKNQLSPDERTKIFIVKKDSNTFFLDTNMIYKNWGLPIRCIEDLSESIKTNTYDYKLLMPYDYKILKSKIFSLFPFNSDIKNGDKIEIASNINFTSFGENASIITKFKSSFFDKEKELNHKNNLQNLLNTTLPKPIYRGQNVISTSELKYDIVFYKKKEYDLYSYFKDDYQERVKLFNSISSSLNKDIINAKELGLNPKIEYKSKVIFINNQKVDSISEYVLSSVKSDNFRYNLLCIIPGLGIINAEPNRKRIPGIKLFHISIPLGALSLGSLIYSSVVYNNYRNSKDFPETKYKLANTFHKVFLSTAATYSLLGLIDFSMTFKLSLKNKKLVNRINNEIQNKHNGALLLN